MPSSKLPRLIGLTGRAGSGKDTFADYLVRVHGFQKYALAGPLKAMLNQRFGWTMEQWNDREWKEAANLVHKQDIDWQCGGMDFGTPSYSPRQLAQWLGTEVGRAIGPNVWVNMMVRAWEERNDAYVQSRLEAIRSADYINDDSNAPRMVITDMRFDNEADAVRLLGGKVVEIVRPNVAAVAAHSSEAGINRCYLDAVVVNDLDIPALLARGIEALTN